MGTPKEETLALCEEALEAREKLKELRKQLDEITKLALMISEEDKIGREIYDLARAAWQMSFIEEGPARETKALLLRSWADLDRKKRYRHRQAEREGREILPQRLINFVTQSPRKSPDPDELKKVQQKLSDEDQEALDSFLRGEF